MSGKQTGRILNLRSRVDMVATETHPTIKAGVKFDVHPEQVPNLEKRGWATKPNEETKASKTKKD